MPQEVELPNGHTVEFPDSMTPQQILAALESDPSIKRLSGPQEPAGVPVTKDIQKWLGVPYKFGGECPTGVDCSSFTQQVYSGRGIKIPRTASAQAQVASHGQTIQYPKDLQPGDQVFFKDTYKPGISHTGIYLDRGKFVHASSGQKKVVISDLSAPYYQEHWAQGLRHAPPVSKTIPQVAKTAKTRPVSKTDTVENTLGAQIARDAKTIGLTMPQYKALVKQVGIGEVQRRVDAKAGPTIGPRTEGAQGFLGAAAETYAPALNTLSTITSSLKPAVYRLEQFIRNGDESGLLPGDKAAIKQLEGKGYLQQWSMLKEQPIGTLGQPETQMYRERGYWDATLGQKILSTLSTVVAENALDPTNAVTVGGLLKIVRKLKPVKAEAKAVVRGGVQAGAQGRPIPRQQSVSEPPLPVKPSLPTPVPETQSQAIVAPNRPRTKAETPEPTDGLGEAVPTAPSSNSVRARRFILAFHPDKHQGLSAQAAQELNRLVSEALSITRVSKSAAYSKAENAGALTGTWDDLEAEAQAIIDKDRASQGRPIPRQQVVSDAPVAVKASLPTPVPETAVGKPVASANIGPTQTVLPEDIHVMPGIQYKREGITDPKNAVSNLLKGTDVYDVDQAGELVVYKHTDGKLYAVDAHHRAELAKRAKSFIKVGPEGKPVEQPRGVKVLVLDSKDGWTVQSVREYGALMNVRGEKGTGLDALEAFRSLGLDDESLKSRGVSLRGTIARNMRGLRSLDDQALSRVRMGDVPEDVAAGVGTVEGLTPEAQRGAMQDAYVSKLRTHDDGARLAREYLYDQEKGLLGQGEEGDLFGGEMGVAGSSRGQRVEIENEVRKRLSAKYSDLLKPVDQKLLEGEHISKEERTRLARAMGESGKAVRDRVSLVFEYNQSVRDETARLAAEVASGRITVREAAEAIQQRVVDESGRSVADIVAGGSRRVDGANTGTAREGTGLFGAAEEVTPAKPPTPKPPKAAEAAPAKEPWQMTRPDYMKSEMKQYGLTDSPLDRVDRNVLGGIVDDDHFEAVSKAVADGKPVPPEVLADYPDLKPRAELPSRRLEATTVSKAQEPPVVTEPIVSPRYKQPDMPAKPVTTKTTFFNGRYKITEWDLYGDNPNYNPDPPVILYKMRDSVTGEDVRFENLQDARRQATILKARVDDLPAKKIRQAEAERVLAEKKSAEDKLRADREAVVQADHERALDDPEFTGRVAKLRAMAKPNPTSAEKAIRDLEEKGFLVEGEDELSAYREIDRGDYESAAEYAEAKKDAWDDFVDTLAERTGLSESELAARTGKYPPLKPAKPVTASEIQQSGGTVSRKGKIVTVQYEPQVKPGDIDEPFPSEALNQNSFMGAAELSVRQQYDKSGGKEMSAAISNAVNSGTQMAEIDNLRFDPNSGVVGVTKKAGQPFRIEFKTDADARAFVGEKPVTASEKAVETPSKKPRGTSGIGDPGRVPDPILSEQSLGEIEAAALTDGRIELRDRAAPGLEKSRVSSTAVIDAMEGVLKSANRPAPIRTGRMGRLQAVGVYKNQPEVIRLRTANNIPTAAHEVGHGLQRALYDSVKSSSLRGLPVPVRREMLKLGKALYGTRKPTAGYTSEGWAEFTRHYLTRDDASTVAPQTFQWFEQNIVAKNPELAEALGKARESTTTYRQQGASNRARANMQGALSIRQRVKTALDLLRRAPREMVDEFAPLYDLGREAERLGRTLKPSENPAIVGAALRGTAPAKVAYMVEHGMIDHAANPVGPALADATAIVEGRKEDFTAYLWAKRAVERWGKGKNPGMALEDAEALVRDLGSPEFEIAAQKVYDWERGVLNYVKGMAPDLAPLIDKILAKSNDYVPLQRVFDEPVAGTRRFQEGDTGDPLKRMKGSGRRVQDIFPQMIQNAEHMVSMAHKRAILDAIIKLEDVPGIGKILEEVPKDLVPFSVSTQEIAVKLQQAGIDIDADEITDSIITFFTPAKFPKGKDPILPVMRDGNVKWYYVDPVLYETLEGTDLYRLPKVLDLVFGAPARAFRLGTTGLRASFSLVTNPARDVQTLIQQTQGNPAKALAEWAQAMGNNFHPRRLKGERDPAMDAFLRLGVQIAQPLGMDIALTRRTAANLFRGKTAKIVRDPLNAARELLSIPESAPRIAELKVVAEQIGWTPGQPMTFDQSIQLALAAKQVTVDFSAAGRIGKVMNQMVPFFNAAIQGIRQFGTTIKRNPAQAIVRGLTAVTIPALYLWWKNKDEDWYKDMPDREKHLYFHIPFGDQDLMIPTAFEYSNLFKVMPEALLDSWYRKDPEGVKGALGHVFETTTPDVTPVLLKAAKEQWTNRIDFFDRPIVPRGEMDLPAGEQRTPYSSAVARFMGDKFPDKVSPRRVDALIRSLFGGAVPDVMQAVGLGGASSGGRELADTAVVGRLFRRGGVEGVSSKAVERFYDTYGLAKQRQKSKTPETTLERNRRLSLEDASKALKSLREQLQAVKTPADRQQLQRAIRAVAQSALNNTQGRAPKSSTSSSLKSLDEKFNRSMNKAGSIPAIPN